MNAAASSIVVTGLGLMTGLGLNLEESWQGLIQGKSVTAPFRNLDASNLCCPYGVELPESAEEFFISRIKPRKRSQMTRSTQMGLVTAEMAVNDAGLVFDALDRSRVGVVIGTTGTAHYADGNRPEEMHILKSMSNSPASWISLHWKLNGPSFVVGTACSSGVYALAAAYGLIRSGQCDVVISGAIDSSINGSDIEGFCSLMAMAGAEHDAATASRPFDKKRSGFVIGEGGGILVVESVENARKRNAEVYSVMHSPGLYSESYNILSPEPKGRGMARCMRIALEQSGLSPEDVDYINAHGTSTLVNDQYETEAIKDILGEHAFRVPVSATKSMTGHCLGGGAGVEAVICCQAIRESMIPPTINLTCPDPGLDLDFVPHTARTKKLHHVMSNSFAFGGHNGVNIFSSPEFAGER